MTPAETAVVRRLVEALIRLGEHEQSCEVFDLDEEGRHCACTCGFDAALTEARALLAAPQAAPDDERSPHTVMTLDIRHYPEPEPDGSWAVFGPPGSGLTVAHPSIDVVMGDVLPCWRVLAELSPSQVPPVPAAPQAAQEPADERALFEAWFSDGGESPRAVERDMGCGYRLQQAQQAWIAWQEAWQAARAQSPPTRITWNNQGRRLVNWQLADESQAPDSGEAAP